MLDPIFHFIKPNQRNIWSCMRIQRWTTSDGGLTHDPIGVKGYFGITAAYFTHKITK